MQQSAFLSLPSFLCLLTTFPLALCLSANDTNLLLPPHHGPACSGDKASAKDCAYAILKLPHFAEYGNMPRERIWPAAPYVERHGGCQVLGG